MYNRYVLSDNGIYQRIPAQDLGQGSAAPSREPPRQDRGPIPPPPRSNSAVPPPPRRERGLLSGLLGKLRLEELDSGDLLLLAVMILLFRDGEDEELLIALGLLLIL